MDSQVSLQKSSSQKLQPVIELTATPRKRGRPPKKTITYRSKSTIAVPIDDHEPEIILESPRRRGRPRKLQTKSTPNRSDNIEIKNSAIPKRRGRPPKNKQTSSQANILDRTLKRTDVAPDKIPKRRGRPSKNVSLGVECRNKSRSPTNVSTEHLKSSNSSLTSSGSSIFNEENSFVDSPAEGMSSNEQVQRETKKRPWILDRPECIEGSDKEHEEKMRADVKRREVINEGMINEGMINRATKTQLRRYQVAKEKEERDKQRIEDRKRRSAQRTLDKLKLKRGYDKAQQLGEKGIEQTEQKKQFCRAKRERNSLVLKSANPLDEEEERHRDTQENSNNSKSFIPTTIDQSNKSDQESENDLDIDDDSKVSESDIFDSGPCSEEDEQKNDSAGLQTINTTISNGSSESEMDDSYSESGSDSEMDDSILDVSKPSTDQGNNFVEYENEDRSLQSNEEIDLLKAKIFPKLITSTTLNNSPYQYELDSKVEEIYKMLESTIVEGVKNSCFLFGPRNSGKTLAVNTALQKINQNHGASDFITVRLNGAAYTDDKSAFRAVADQLDMEIARIYSISLKDLGNNELIARKSISDTISNILKILDDEVNISETRKSNKHLRDSSNAKLRIPIIFIIDEVEKYVTQFRQTLLYNLFDLSHSSITPITIICSTSVYNIRESLEKRVRSRSSQRSIQFNRFSKEKFIDVCSRMIKVDDPENDYEKEWNSDIDRLLSEKGSNLRKNIIFNHMTECNVSKFQTESIYPIQNLSVDSPRILDENFARLSTHQNKASLKATLNKLSDLDLALLISSARVVLKQDNNKSTLNFNMTYDEYLKCLALENTQQSSTSTLSTTASRLFKKWSKQQCQESWEYLVIDNFLTKPTINTNRMMEKFGSVSFETRTWSVEVSLDDLRRCLGADKIMKSWTRL